MNTSSSTVSQEFATAKVIFYTSQTISLVFATVLVVALRSSLTRSSFTDNKTRAKAAFRLVLFFVGIGDMVQTSSVVPYIFDPPHNGCHVAAVVSSTGVLMSSILTACLSFEGFLLVSKGVRDGEKFRAAAYLTCTAVAVLVIQVITGITWGFGASSSEQEQGNYMWCHLEHKTFAAEMFSFYGPLSCCFLVCLVGYLSMDCKLKHMLRVQGMNDAIRRTLNRSRMKFLLFPLIFVCSWLPTGIHRIVISNTPVNQQTSTFGWFLLYFSGLTAESLPIWNAVFFCFFNPEARVSLQSFVYRYCCCWCSTAPTSTEALQQQQQQQLQEGEESDSGTRAANVLDDSMASWGEAGLLDSSFTDSDDHSSPFGIGDHEWDDNDDLPNAQIYASLLQPAFEQQRLD